VDKLDQLKIMQASAQAHIECQAKTDLLIELETEIQKEGDE